MSRELKFRVWQPEQKQFYFATLPGNTDNISEIATHYRTDIQLSIGLKDKNGVEIYEGDIVSCDQAQGLEFKVVGIVHYGIARESSGWCDPRIYLDTRPFEKYGSEFCIFHKQPEVIGTIYGNPNLLSSEEEA